MTTLDGKVPFQLTLTAAEGVSQEGIVFKITSDALTIITAKGDTAVAIANQKLADTEGTATTARTGQKVAVFMIGCGAIVNVAATKNETWAVGEPVYLDDTVDGMVSITAATSRPIGHYVGDGETTTVATDGDVIPIVLDVQIGAANV